MSMEKLIEAVRERLDEPIYVADEVFKAASREHAGVIQGRVGDDLLPFVHLHLRAIESHCDLFSTIRPESHRPKKKSSMREAFEAAGKFMKENPDLTVEVMHKK